MNSLLVSTIKMVFSKSLKWCLFYQFTVDEDEKSRFTKRRRLFYSAITQFSLKQTLADLEKTLLKSQTPHVISHYSAGARLIGLTTRQLTQQMKKMQKTAANHDSPYAKPLMFVHLGTRKIVKRVKSPRKSTSRSRVTVQGPSEADGDKEKTEKQADSHVLGISKEIQNQLKLFAQRGSIAAQLPDAHKLIEWRRNSKTLPLFVKEIESHHDKTNKIICAPSEDSVQPGVGDSDQPGHPPSPISLRCPQEESLCP